MSAASDLVNHEEAHATVAEWAGWTVTGIHYSVRGGSGSASYRAPLHDLGTWREVYVTLAGLVADVQHDAREYGLDVDVARDVVIKSILRKVRRIIRSGFAPKKVTDEWKLARILVRIHGDDLCMIEAELRDAWSEVSSILEASS